MKSPGRVRRHSSISGLARGRPDPLNRASVFLNKYRTRYWRLKQVVNLMDEEYIDVNLEAPADVVLSFPRDLTLKVIIFKSNNIHPHPLTPSCDIRMRRAPEAVSSNSTAVAPICARLMTRPSAFENQRLRDSARRSDASRVTHPSQYAFNVIARSKHYHDMAAAPKIGSH
ncbi:hypothetical protein EVAR_490_1 [Eumeta japonica]|uniref:Uncharacterized protein n=1 Tax=Eumeta variegata TaxID=151549 RepID=A0A4C1SDL4_EUMVA|nr:hypothetical protein EVAR_490_1 [Eumeta japonica]